MARPVRRPRRSRDLRQAALRPAGTHGPVPGSRSSRLDLAPARRGNRLVAGCHRRRLGERGLDISRAAVGRVLAEAHVRPHKVRGWLNRADDPSFWAKAGAVCRLYLNPPPGTS